MLVGPKTHSRVPAPRMQQRRLMACPSLTPIDRVSARRILCAN